MTRFALHNRAFVIAILAFCLCYGPLSLISHPSREDPAITIREASVVARYDGMSAARIEQLITSKLEEKIREISAVDTIETISSAGRSLVKITLADAVIETKTVWADLRNKMDDVVSELPTGVIGPFVNDDKGNVAMATIAMTAEGFSNAEMKVAAKALRRAIYSQVNGVRKVEFFGVEERRVFVEFDSVRLARLGLDVNAVASAISSQNVILPGGRIEAEGATFYIEPTGDFETLETLRDTPLTVAGSDTPVYLSDIATVRFGYQDPPSTPVFWNGKPAIVVSVSMIDADNAGRFGAVLNHVVKAFEQQLPIGFELNYVTWQPAEIDAAIFGVFNNLWQTILIVLAVVIAFLGLRAGLIVGALVPIVMIVTTLLMRPLGVDLERMSLASLIIALGLLVDNAIVIAEDIRERLSRGEERLSAVVASGQSMTAPLLAASLTTIFAFMPLMLAPGSAGEYTRSISIVIALALIVSWVLALTVLTLLCFWFLRAENKTADDGSEGVFMAYYRRLITLALNWKYVSIGIAVATLPIGAWLFSMTSKTFFPQSERTQLQIVVELPEGRNAFATREVVEKIEGWLLDKESNPEVLNVASYVGDGGPRFYLALSPIDRAPNTAYMLVNVNEPKDVLRLADRVRRITLDRIPEAEIYPKPMSMGPGEAGLVEFRISGPDVAVLKGASEQLQRAMRSHSGTIEVKDDWKNPVITLKAVIDQEAARRAGVSSEDIATALNSQLSGRAVTEYRVGEESFPIVFRTDAATRTMIDRLPSLTVGISNRNPVTLEQVARIEPEPGFAQMRRRNLERVVTVSAKSLVFTAAEFTSKLSAEVESLERALPRGYRIEIGGEVESSADAQRALFANVPIAFALMLLVLIWQFGSFKKTMIVVLTIPLVITGVASALLLAPGANFSFMGILGFLALCGIVINNAIVLLDQIEIERIAGKDRDQALVDAGVRRLRPIIMTTCTTALGVAPIIVSRDVLFYDLAIVVAGGLTMGTILTLVVAPCLFAIFFSKEGFRRV